jgi:hypothetical protein
MMPFFREKSIALDYNIKYSLLLPRRLEGALIGLTRWSRAGAGREDDFDNECAL